jgi:hypothetical protein
MSRWFRFHAAAMRNPKVARLSDKEFRLWVELLATACENDGFITCLEDLKHVLKRRLDHLSTGVERLISMGLIDRLDHGYEPHGWSKHQYKSDTSTDRVQKHREKRNVSVTPPETDTEQITDTEVIEAKASSARAKVDPFPCPDGVDTIDWEGLKANRKAKRAALTEGAYRQITSKLDRWHRAGWPPGPVVAYAVERGWTTVFETDEMKGQANGNRKNGTDGAMRALDRQLGLDGATGTVGRTDLPQGERYSLLPPPR